MTDWLEHYSAALDLRDAREKAHKPYIDAYTKLADRTAAASNPLPQPSLPNHQTSTTSSSPAPPSHTSTPKSKLPPTTQEEPQDPSADLLIALRNDLSTTQKARSLLSTEITTLNQTLTHLRTASTRSTAQITLLTKQKTDFERKLRDLQEEMAGKAGLVERAQDEMVALGLQLNMSEQKSERLGRENEELVNRWMKRMGEEVERVNRDSRWE